MFVLVQNDRCGPMARSRLFVQGVWLFTLINQHLSVMLHQGKVLKITGQACFLKFRVDFLVRLFPTNRIKPHIPIAAVLLKPSPFL